VGKTVRLAGGLTSRDGRLEVKVGKQPDWSSVTAATGFEAAVAAVVCRQLGARPRGVLAVWSPEDWRDHYLPQYGEVPRPANISNVLCTGKEQTIAGCFFMVVSAETSYPLHVNCKGQCRQA